MLTAVSQCITDTYSFNTIAGQLDDPDKGSIALQLDLIQEEYLEGVEAFDLEDKVGLLDSAIDMWVVVSGLLQKLDKLGFNVSEALTRVSENNLSKFIPLGQPVHYEKGIISEYNDKYEVVVLKDLTGKVRKPVNYKPVDLSDCVPSVFDWGDA